MTDVPFNFSSFYAKSIFERPENNSSLICTPLTWNFHTGNDVRVSHCDGEVSQEEFFNVHTRLGRIHYNLQYSAQPFGFQTAANPAFQNAIGEFMRLSASSVQYLKNNGLLGNFENDYEAKINILYEQVNALKATEKIHLIQYQLQALKYIAVIPFAYTMERFRFLVFRGKTEPAYYNTLYWNMRFSYTGVEPPEPRSETEFDFGAKFRFAQDGDFFGDMISVVLQFQIYDALCKNAKQKIHSCDVTVNPENGKILR